MSPLAWQIPVAARFYLTDWGEFDEGTDGEGADGVGVP